VTKNHQGVVSVSDYAGKFGFQDFIQQGYRRGAIQILISHYFLRFHLLITFAV
jgi:hypothetical protein